MLQDYVLLARIKGFRELRLVLQEALRNAVGPTLTLTGVQFTFLIGGTVIVERIFSYQGIGNLAIDAVINRDLPLIQGLVLVFGDLHPDQSRGRSHGGGAQSAAAAWLSRQRVEHWSPTAMTSTQQAEPRPPSTALRLARDPKVVVAGGFILLLIVLAVFAPFIAPHDPLAQDLLAATLPPLGFPDAEPGFLLGTDRLGRDVLSRLIYGARIALTVAFVAAGLACLIGSLLGLLAGFFRGWVDALISRLVDIWMAFPPVLLSILLVAVLGTGLHSVIAAIVVIDWTRFCRVVRAETMGQAQMDYVAAARTSASRAPPSCSARSCPMCCPS